MSDAWLPFGLLLSLYFLEGLWWEPLEAFVVSGGLGGGFRRDARLPPRRDARTAWFLPRRLVAAGQRFVSCEWPVSLSPQGIAPRARDVPDRGATLAHPVPFDDVQAFTTSGPRLLHRGKRFARTGSPREARELLRGLRKIAATEPRSQGLVEAIDRALDEGEARRRARRLRWAVRRVRWLPAALFANLFVLGPGLLAFLGGWTWPVPVTLHVALAALAVAAFARVDRALYPGRDDRFATLLMLLLFPPSTARFAELLSRDLMAGLHPIAVAAALDRRLLEELARGVVVESRRRSVKAPCDHDDDPEEWFRRTFEARALRAFERLGLDPEALVEPPSPEAGAVAYCPRCLAQYRSEGRDCADCEGMALVPLGTG